jgi:hypothetical protein
MNIGGGESSENHEYRRQGGSGVAGADEACFRTFAVSAGSEPAFSTFQLTWPLRFFPCLYIALVAEALVTKSTLVPLSLCMYSLAIPFASRGILCSERGIIYRIYMSSAHTPQ